MKIKSKRGRCDPEVKEIGVVDSYGVIIFEQGVMTPEEIKRAEEAIRDLRRQLEELGSILDTGWYGRP